ncbi:hypothetical protein, partial [Geobacillus subterraneus]|uniref:hypothetical protein n=1 Tax=Geobacillus subterraneus TaxID=129338 RepID=UPI001C88CD2C
LPWIFSVKIPSASGDFHPRVEDRSRCPWNFSMKTTRILRDHFHAYGGNRLLIELCRQDVHTLDCYSHVWMEREVHGAFLVVLLVG